MYMTICVNVNTDSTLAHKGSRRLPPASFLTAEFPPRFPQTVSPRVINYSCTPPTTSKCVDIKECFFHLSQSMHRKLQESGPQAGYWNDAEFAVKTRMIPDISFAPVIESFEAVQEHLGDEFEPLLYYFEDNYIGRLRRTTWRPPRYAHELWNMHVRADDELPKTNNHVGGWHRRMKEAVTACHPPIWGLIEVLQQDYALNAVNIEQIDGGHTPEPRRKKYVHCEL